MLLMNRRRFLKSILRQAALGASAGAVLWRIPCRAEGGQGGVAFKDTPQGRDWLARWEKYIVSDSSSRFCDKEMGEELGWLVSPYLDGFYYGWLATHDEKWAVMLVDWADSCIKRAVKEPDGFVGWPKGDGGGNESKEYSADSLLGEAMLLRPIVSMAGEIRKTPSLKEKFGDRAEAHLKLAEEIFQKWDSRDCWRETKDGGLWVVPAFGVDTKTGGWSAGYTQRKTTGFSNPANKENLIARWLLAMSDVTGRPVYRERAEKWFKLMRSRMKTRENGKYFVWNYWDPAGPWDYTRGSATKHWVGVHPNGGYYAIDVEAMVAAFEHGLAFSRADIDRLIATNRDFMWNQQVEKARFRRIDGGSADPRWLNSPGVLWSALAPYDSKLRGIFLANNQPASWSSMAATPWFLARDAAEAPKDSK